VIINKAFKFRIYPTQAQGQELAKHFGACRFVYNYFLRQRIDYYAAHKGEKKQGLNYHDTALRLTQLKKQLAYQWLNDANSQSLQQSLRHLDAAYNNFFKKRGEFPKFKSKRDRQACSIPQHFRFDAKRKRLSIPKIGEIKIVPHRPVEGTIKSITVTQTPAGRYFASLLCEVKAKKPKTQNRNEIAIDLGVKTFAVTSADELIESPKFFRQSEIKLARLQRQLSRKKNGSRNREKARIKVARLHEKIVNQRLDFLHKTSRRLADENQAVYVEDLNVKGMTANHCLAKSIADASWSEFVRQLNYKLAWRGGRLVQVDRFFPSSKRCHICGYIKQDLTLADREWTCPECSAQHNRDVNAAKNILIFGKGRRVGTTQTQRAGRLGNVSESLSREATPL
jgi:putative transposase